jgi:hypothetical protein
MTWAAENPLRGGAWGGTDINDIMTIENFDEREIVRHEMMRRAHLGRIDDKVRRSLLDIAFHEAGHAVLAWITGRKIERVSMISDVQHARLLACPDHEVQAGSVVLAPLPREVDLRDPRYRVLAEREAMIALAGELATIRRRGSRKGQSLNRGDLARLTYVAAQAEASKEPLESYLDRLVARTALYLDVYWSYVEKLADALLERRELTGRQARGILRGVESGSGRFPFVL